MATKSSKNRASKGINVHDDRLLTDKEIITRILSKKINVKAKNVAQKNTINLIRSKEITFVAGVAGTGKTYIALATALDLLSDPSTPYNKIYLVKSVTSIPNEEVGFLKGSIEDKIEPIMWSYMMNVNKLITESTITNLLEQNYVKFLPLAYIRGLSIDNAIIILDETQNITLDTLRTILTRIGDNSKFIALGDIKQIDLKQKEKSALGIALKMFEDVEQIGVMEFSSDDIVRNPIIKVIEEKFDKYDLENVNSKSIRKVL